MKYIGLDGCRKGWFYVGLNDDTTFEVGVISSISAIRDWLATSTLILIDIPIGLPTNGRSERGCDTAARQMIKPRGSTVFPAPARPAIYKETYEEASAENRRCLQRGLSQQSFQICKKIREVDEFMRFDGAREKVREYHPEVAFCALNNMNPLLSKKKKADGYEERMTILRAFNSRAEEIVLASRQAEPLKKNLADDDIVDALVGAVTASHFPRLTTLPQNPAIDDTGLPMEMVYAQVRR